MSSYMSFEPGGESNSGGHPKWYALFVRSNQERQVVLHLGHRGIEHFFPSYSSVRKWKDRRKIITMPLFPGYLFVRLSVADRLKVVTVPHVVSIVGTGTSYSAISDDEVDWIRRAVECGKAQPHPYLNEGTRVRITQGVMSGLRGIILFRQDGTRVVVSLETIARSFAVDVDAEWVQPDDQASARAS